MCYRPIYLYNPTNNFNPLFDKLRLTVPCGKCCECKKRKQNDFYVRSYYEYQRNIKEGGFSLFFTLTYSNKVIPTVNGKYVFNKRDIQLFLKRLRQQLHRSNIPIAFRYIITSEYGGKTHRPHYHGIFFCYPNQHVEWSIWSFIPTLKKLIKSTWLDSIVDYGKDLGRGQGIVANSRALNYVCKYITKDVDFESQKDLQEIDKIHKPFHLQSKGFGKYMLDLLKKDGEWDIDKLVSGTVTIPYGSDYHTFVFPQYIDRHLYYERAITGDYTSPFVRNDLYTYIQELRLPQTIEDKVSKLSDEVSTLVNYLKSPSTSEMSFSTFKLYFSETYGSNRFTFETPHDVLQVLAPILKDINYDSFARYVLLYKDRVDFSFINDDLYSTLAHIYGLRTDTIDLPDVDDLLRFDYNNSKDLLSNINIKETIIDVRTSVLNDSPRVTRPYRCRTVKEMTLPTYNHHAYDFELLLALINTFNYVAGLLKQLKYDTTEYYHSLSKKLI